MDMEQSNQRDEQHRRTRRATAWMTGAGVAGSLGVAAALGLTTGPHATAATTTTTSGQSSTTSRAESGQTGQGSPSGQDSSGWGSDTLVSPGQGGPSQATTGGS